MSRVAHISPELSNDDQEAKSRSDLESNYLYSRQRSIRPVLTTSILITSKNESDFLDRSINSALNQTHQPHEIVVVDAASEDDSQSLIREYVDSYPDVVRGVLLDEDPGIPEMRNIALESATGDLYTFLDGDDWFHPKN